ncbi:MAG: MotA/TolQ/ExbB proton channel family protein [Myxococcota bacterium]|nr:MotA/TolQ/ExbB proton channel family protein [Myxococcota bacterium]
MLDAIITLQDDISGFLDVGGDVMVGIYWATFLMWVLITERYIYFATRHESVAEELKAIWLTRRTNAEWAVRAARHQLSSLNRQSATATLGLIKTLVAVCPLLGLLGTVTGMIEVFDVMAISGSGNARAMAAGVSQATVSTMAGMVSALSGLYFSARLQQRAEKEMRQFDDGLE